MFKQLNIEYVEYFLCFMVFYLLKRTLKSLPECDAFLNDIKIESLKITKGLKHKTLFNYE